MWGRMRLLPAEQQRAFFLLDEELAEHGLLPKNETKNESEVGMDLPAAGRATALFDEEIRSRVVAAGGGSSSNADGAQARRAVPAYWLNLIGFRLARTFR